MCRKISKKKDFEKVYKNGLSFYNHILGLKILQNNKRYNRCAVVVSLKTEKRAVYRNKIKRTIKEYLRVLLREISKKYDVVVLVSKKTKQINKEELKRAVYDNFNKFKKNGV